MPRKPADLRISIKRRGGKTHRIELIRQPFGQRFWVRRDGKISETLPEPQPRTSLYARTPAQTRRMDWKF